MFTRQQLEVIVHIFLSSFCDTIDSCFAAKEIGAFTAEADARWKKERRETNWEPHTFVCAILNQLSWNLSIFYHKVTNDGMGCGDALDAANVGNVLEAWADEWIAGNIGLQDGKYHRPDLEKLTKAWCDVVFAQVDTQTFLDRIAAGYYDYENGTAQFKNDVLNHYGVEHEAIFNKLFHNSDLEGRARLEEVLGDFVKLV